jgi:hypothetical protein
MPIHADLLANMPVVREALIRRYTWFIHVTPVGNLASIRSTGLKPVGDAPPPPEVESAGGVVGKNILCLHPLGARKAPQGTKDPPFASIAISSEDLPGSIGLDWSYAWDLVESRFSRWPDLSIEHFVSRIVRCFGSVVSYEPVAPMNLRVCDKSSPPTNPLGWPSLLHTQDDQVYRHR